MVSAHGQPIPFNGEFLSTQMSLSVLVEFNSDLDFDRILLGTSAEVLTSSCISRLFLERILSSFLHLRHEGSPRSPHPLHFLFISEDLRHQDGEEFFAFFAKLLILQLLLLDPLAEFLFKTLQLSKIFHIFGILVFLVHLALI